jgi:hypothetical protein
MRPPGGVAGVVREIVLVRRFLGSSVRWFLGSSFVGSSVVIRTSAAREIERLVAQLRDGSPVEREGAIARLRVIGPRAIDRLTRLIRSAAPAAAHAAALKALEGIDDARSRDLAIEHLTADTPAVATAAVAALRPWLASDASALDAVTALALDTSRKQALRLAALDALSELPRATILPVLQQVGGDDPALAARAAGEASGATLDQPGGMMEWLAVRGGAAPLSAIHDAIVRIRDHERDEPAAKRRQEWQMTRAAAHRVLASRGSRVALYDLRETFDAAQASLPRDFLTAITLVGDASCLEPLARSWSAAEKDLWWRDRLATAARAIVAREKLTARHAAIKRIRSRYPAFLA